jgi:carboxyl-terminal processing protease
VVGVKSFGAGAEQQLFTLRNGDGLLLTTVKWASTAGKPFLGTGVAPSVEVKNPELAEAVDPEELTGNDDDPIAQPNAPADRPAPDATAPKPQPEDVQLKKALELLREKDKQPAAQRAA